MAHSAVLTSNLDGATPLELVAGPTEGIWLAPEGEGLFVPPAYTETFASAPGTEGGIRTRSDPENVVGVGKVYFTGATQAAFWANIATFEQTIEQCRQYGGTLVYEPTSGPTITYEIESAHLLTLPQRGYHLGQRHAESDFELVFKPYGLLAENVGQDISITDNFSYDSIGLGEWTFDAGSGTLAVSGEQLVPSSTAEKRLYQAAIQAADGRGTIKVTTGASVASGHAGFTLKRLTTAADEIRGRVNFAGASSTLLIEKFDTSAATTLATSSSFTTAAATSYWIRFDVTGNVLTLEVFNADPATSSPTALKSLPYTLAGANATKFGTGIYGRPGIRTAPQATDYRFDAWRFETADIVTTEPMMSFEIAPQDGSVDALVDLIAVNGNEDSRNYAFYEWGIESAYWSADYSWPLLINDTEMTLLESATHQVGAATEWRATYTQQSISTTSKGVASATSQHIGRFRVKARVQSSVANAYARLAYRYRGGGLEFLPWVAIPSTLVWYELDLGVVNIPPITQGAEHDVTFSVYMKTTSGSGTGYLDYLKFFPAERYGRASTDDPVAHIFLANLRLTHNGAWQESGFGTDKYHRAPGYVGSYLKIPAKGGRFALYESFDRLDIESHATGFLDDEIRISVVTTTPRVALLGE